MKITAINGSPRTKGNTAALVDAVLKGITQSDNEKVVHYLGDKSIKGCIGCYSCMTTKKCVHKDDMEQINQDILESDVIIFASPIYYFTVTGQFKTFLDRTFPLYWDKPLKGKKSVFALTWADSNPDAFDDTVEWFKRVADATEFELVEVIKVPDTGSNPVSENNSLLAHAEELGRKLVS